MKKHFNTTSERGQTMTEFALVLPILVVFLFGIIQFGIAWNNYVTITDAARAGARKAAVSRDDPNRVSDCQTAVQNAVDSLNMTQPGAGITCLFDPSLQQGSTVQVTVQYPYSINLFGIPITNGTLTSVMKEKLE